MVFIIEIIFQIKSMANSIQMGPIPKSLKSNFNSELISAGKLIFFNFEKVNEF